MSAKPKRKPRKVVEVEWRDSSRTGGWSTWSDYLPASVMVCHSVGYLIERTNDHVSVMQSMDTQENQKMTDMMTIPAECVLRVRVLR